jgi:putative phage-type endonuclease
MEGLTMKIVSAEQYSDEWWAARRGIPTASRFAKLITPGGKPSSQAKQYLCELIAANYAPDEDIVEPSEWMLRGMALEEEARDYLSFKRGKSIKEVGFCVTDDGTFGASPDGIIGRKVPLEIKCPKASTHIAYMLNGKVPDGYLPQCHGQLLVTGSSKGIFMSYHPSLPPVIIEFKRDGYTDMLERAVKVFVKDLAAAKDKLKL